MQRGRRWIAGGMVWALLAAATGTAAEVARWDVDPDHSIIEFRVAHMVVSKIRQTR